MIHDIACLLHNQKCKDALRAIHVQDVKLTLFHKIPETFFQTSTKHFNLYIVDSTHHDSEILFRHTTVNNLYNSTVIVTPKFDRETFQRYIKSGYRYVVDIDTFVYLIPTILENLSDFLENNSYPSKEFTKKGLTISVDRGYMIFHGCKISISKIALMLLCTMLNSNSYCDLKYLKDCLGTSLSKEVSPSYITVTISRLNKAIYQSTGMKIIKNRYGFGYYLDI